MFPLDLHEGNLTTIGAAHQDYVADVQNALQTPLPIAFSKEANFTFDFNSSKSGKLFVQWSYKAKYMKLDEFIELSNNAF